MAWAHISGGSCSIGVDPRTKSVPIFAAAASVTNDESVTPLSIASVSFYSVLRRSGSLWSSLKLTNSALLPALHSASHLERCQNFVMVTCAATDVAGGNIEANSVILGANHAMTESPS